MQAIVDHSTSLEHELAGSYVTLVFGSGVYALSGTVEHVGDGYLVLRATERDRSPAGELLEREYLVPLSSVVYFRLPADNA